MFSNHGFARYMPSSGAAGSNGGSACSLWGPRLPPPQWPRLHSGRAGSAGALPPPPRPLALVACRIFDDGHSDWCEVVSY